MIGVVFYIKEGEMMNVKILECRSFFSPMVLSSKSRVVKDYEIDVEMGEERTVVIDGIEHRIKRGDVCVRKPGQTVYGCGVQHSVLLTLDFSGEQSVAHYSRNIEGPIQPIFDDPLLENLNGIVRPFSEYTFIPIYSELLKSAFVDTDAAQSLIMELIYKLNGEVCRQRYAKRRQKETVCDEALEYMKNNFEKQITLEKLADIVGLDKAYFVRVFKAAYGQTPISFLISLRMERASDLIANTNMTISEIALQCGYNSISYFISEYKKHFGITPLMQRKTN